jgi:hypothetical protein
MILAKLNDQAASTISRSIPKGRAVRDAETGHPVRQIDRLLDDLMQLDQKYRRCADAGFGLYQWKADCDEHKHGNDRQ